MTILQLTSSTTTFCEASNLVISLDHIAGSKKFVKLKYQIIGLMKTSESIFINMGEAFELASRHKLVIKQILNETSIELMII